MPPSVKNQRKSARAGKPVKSSRSAPHVTRLAARHKIIAEICSPKAKRIPPEVFVTFSACDLDSKWRSVCNFGLR